MNQTLIELLSNPEVASVKMELFSFWHILYMTLIILFPFVIACLLHNASAERQDRTLRVVALAVFFVYIGDFFLQPFYNDGQLIVDKLPFHVCTFLCPALMLVQFSGKHRIQWFYDAVALLAIVSPFMYFVYPNTAFGDTYTPWCYRVLQTFLYHGLVYSWGTLALLLGRANCKASVLPKVLIVQAVITLWASVGNALYGYNWYFLQGLDLGFVELKHPVTYLLINLGVFVMVLLVFGMERVTISLRNTRTHETMT